MQKIFTALFLFSLSLALFAMDNSPRPPAYSAKSKLPTATTEKDSLVAPLSSAWMDLLDADFSHWEKFIGVPHVSVPLPEDVPKSENVHVGTPLGLNNDPLGVFTMIEEEGEPVLKINGQVYGGLTTKEAYGNYHLQLQFKWAEKKWPPRLKARRDNGLLYHCTGPHGAFWNVWMRC
ncbi:MAG: hypothetical protein AAF597_17580, partial [Bacteroidota bacterium]